MKVVIIVFLLWVLGSYGVYRLAPAPGWIVAYGLGTIGLFAWLVWRANKNKPSQNTQRVYTPTREDSV